ncbi:hypothetical protein CONCODRAFT_69761 [Conidiobolus coronatus NRRL 28638]|uniref:Uncharacterized protein n=1 Tax=Conidiobolus coronatus (strain ATCC 28846 / CBS 209.66 / NRRL 28638) TaxID=796925 RepID=A0A137P943_CONC2|nr:hypothetical protein CONCODRAFT_69761 [Conidiobolus coronatus NRRL 28638]|eukprot:KXN71509.1 hypothetical protein CONCODRAFT_69761 [Conidiobolus coronatus NRRL 28638]
MPYTTPRLVSSPPKEITELPSTDGMWDGNRSMNLAYGPGGHGRYMTHDGTYHPEPLPSWTQSSPYPHAVNCPSPGKFEASPYFTPQLGNTPIQDQGAVFIGEGAASALGYPFLSSSSTPVVDPSATFEQGSMGDHYLPPLMGFGMDSHSMGTYDQKPGQLNSVPEYSMLPPMKSSADEGAHDNKSIAGIPSRHYNHPYHMNSLPARVDAAEKSYLSHQARHNSLPYSRPSEYENSHSLAEDSFCLSWDALNDSMPSQWNDKSNRKALPASAKRGVRSSTMTHDTHGQNHLTRSAQSSALGLTSSRYQNDDKFDKREKIEGDLENRLPSILKRRTSDFNSALLDGFM